MDESNQPQANNEGGQWVVPPPAGPGDDQRPGAQWVPPPPNAWAPPSQAPQPGQAGPGQAPQPGQAGWHPGQPSHPVQPSAQPGQPYGAGPYGAPGYGQQHQPYGQQHQPYGQQQPYGYSQPGYGQNPYGGPPSWGHPGDGGRWGPPGGQGSLPPGSGWNYGWTPPSSTPQPRRSLPGVVTALLLVVAVFVGLGIGHGVWRPSRISISSSGSGTNGGSSGTFPSFGSGGSGGNGGSGSSGGGSVNTAPITSAVDPGLVDIDTVLLDGEAAGTGIVLSSDGYVLTNNHVISGATSIKATDIGNGQTYSATVVGYDRTQDVAVIKLSGASGLTTAKLGNSDNVSVNETIVGIGNAGGTGGTPSAAAGQVTALGQSITAEDEGNGTSENLTGLIETNADIQPGDSGGALANSSGQVIGMDTAASSGFSIQNSGNQGFAIPINEALSISKTIRSGTETSLIHIGPTAFLGVDVDISPPPGTSGAVLEQVVGGGPAAQAGLGSGDVITSLGGSPVTSANDLTNLISHHHPGDNVKVVWTDSSGESHSATVSLASGPAA